MMPLAVFAHSHTLLLASRSISGPFMHATRPQHRPRVMGTRGASGGSNAGAAARGHDGAARVKPWSGQEEREERSELGSIVRRN